jgi:ribosomal protein S18 acetylase RimI-like enzyme
MRPGAQMTAHPDNKPVDAFEAADRTALLRLWQRCGLAGPDAVRSIAFALGRDHTAILLGRASGTPIASVMVGHDGHAGFLYFVAVDPEHRGQGWGRAVVQEAESWLAARLVWRSMLMIRPDNVNVAAFYERLGWTAVPNLVMQKRLLP